MQYEKIDRILHIKKKKSANHHGTDDSAYISALFDTKPSI